METIEQNTLQSLVKHAEEYFFPWVIEEIVIETDDQLKNMSDLLGVGKKIVSALEAARKGDKQPFIDGGKEVDDSYRPTQNRVQLGVTRLDSAVLVYHRRKKAEADALLEMQAKELAVRQKEAEALQIQQMQENVSKSEECAQTGEVFEPVPLTTIPQAEELIVKPVGGTVRGNMSSTAIIDSFEYFIQDENLVPRELCSPDLKKIKAKHKYDKKPIPGVLITPKSHTSTRLG